MARNQSHSGGFSPLGGCAAQTPAWASDFDAWTAERLSTNDVDGLSQYAQRPETRLAHPTVEHFSPILVAAGAAWGEGGGTGLSYPISGFELGSIARRSVQFG
jgi:4,5-DOPA dioxygenase extradiol